MERVRTPHIHQSDIVLPYRISYLSRSSEDFKCSKCHCSLTRICVQVHFPSHSSSYHVDCFFEEMSRGTNVISVDLVHGIDELELDDMIKFMDKMNGYQRELAKITYNTAAELFVLNPHPSPENQDRPIGLTRNVIDLAHCKLRLPGKSSIESEVSLLDCCRSIIKPNEVVVESNNKLTHFRCLLNTTDCVVGKLDLMDGWIKIDEKSREEFENQLENHMAKLDRIYIPRCDNLAFNHKKEDQQPFIFSTAHAFVWRLKVNVMCHLCCDTIHENHIVFFLNLNFSHSHCVFRDAKTCFDTPEDIPGFWSLSEVMQAHLMMQFNVALQNGELMAMTLPRVARYAKGSCRAHKPDISEDIKNQLDAFNTLRWRYSEASLDTMESILIANKQESSRETDEILLRLMDISLFGVPVQCPVCHGNVTYKPGRRIYSCNGYSSEFSKCSFETENPRRIPFKMPEIAMEIDFSEITTHKNRFYLEPLNNNNYSKLKAPLILPAEFSELAVPSSKIKKAVNSPGHCSRYLIKNGTAVPSISENSPSCHIMKEGDSDVLYEAFLTLVECQENKNTSAHIMILEEDVMEQYHVLKIVSRLGTQFLEKSEISFDEKSEAIEKFSEQFWQFTGNSWIDRDRFEKKSGKFQRVELWSVPAGSFQNHNYSQVELEMLENRQSSQDDSISGLNCQEIVSKNQYVGGLISRKSNEFLKKVLSELRLKVVNKTAKKMDFIEATNTVYSLLPTNFGFGNLTMIKNISDIQDVLQALNDQSQVIRHHEDQPCGIDFPLTWKSFHYLKHVKQSSDDWRIIEKYLKNTIGSTHCLCKDVELIDILKINRVKRFVEHPGGSMLLWHGTNKENLSSIFDNGLLKNPGGKVRFTGSMFGKGVYFADCFSKSYNYAKNYGDGDVYMFLCQVFTGSLFHSWSPIYQEQVEQELATGKFDSIKGNGRFVPDPKDVALLNDAQVPYGKLQLMTFQGLTGVLDYNEYVVYDESRITLRYLVRVKCI